MYAVRGPGSCSSCRPPRTRSCGCGCISWKWSVCCRPGSGQPLWWTLRKPFRPLGYHAAHRMFERAGAAADTDATLQSLRHTAAYRMAEDPALPLADVQPVLGHALLTTMQLYLTYAVTPLRRYPQGGRDPADPGPPRRAGPPGPAARSAGPGAGLPAREPGCAVREPAVVTASGAAPPRPPRPAAAGWPATAQAREQVAGRLPASGARQRQRPGGITGLAGRPGRRQLATALAGQRRRRCRRRVVAAAPRQAAAVRAPCPGGGRAGLGPGLGNLR